MGRIIEALRIPTVDAFLGHYTQAENADGGDLPIVEGVARPQLFAKRNQYHSYQQQMISVSETQPAALMAEREATWGLSPEDENGLWFQLRLYKPMVRLRLGARHPLGKTVPNIGNVYVSTMGDICFRFEDHWTRVNAALLALTKPPLTLGDFTLALLQAGHTTIEARNTALKALTEGTRPLLRAEMERLYGDVPDDDREDDSLVTLMEGYTIMIQTKFPGQPLALSLPRIFPRTPSGSVTTFRFNWVAQGPSTIKTWIETPDEPEAAVVFLKEGVVEQTQPFDPSNPGSTQIHIWNNIQVIGDLDELELQDADGTTLARGDRDTDFAEPTEP